MIKSKYVFLGGLFPKSQLTDIESKSIGVIQYAANSLQYSIIEGFDSANIDISIVNLLFVGSYPKRYKKLYIESYDFTINNRIKGYNVGFNNFTGIKLLDRFFQAKKFLINSLSSKNEVLFIYSVHLPFLLAAIAAKRKYPSLKICLIIPDLPEFMGNLGPIRRIIFALENRLVKYVLQSFDFFVLLAKPMAKYLEIEHKPNIVVEGIFNRNDDMPFFEKEQSITILYSGTLSLRYGISTLLAAFSSIPNNNFRLWILGDGDGLSTVIEYAGKDSRIKYWGQLPRKQVLELQRRATILVNPRNAESDFTKYSFPSKIMEYFASGTPTILYPLDGIPDEYFQHCFIVKDSTVNTLRDKIMEVANLTPEERFLIGQKARRFILEEKNELIQSKKIQNLVKG